MVIWYNIGRSLIAMEAVMRLSKSVSKNATSLYVIESTYIHGKSSTRTVESLGTIEELSKTHDDPIAWAKEYVKSLNEKQKIEREKDKASQEILIRFNSQKPIPKDAEVTFNGGYLFLQKLFYQLGLDDTCLKCQKGTRADYNLSDILSRLVYGRILYPGSKRKTVDLSEKLIEPPTFEEHDVYRALTVLADNAEVFQSDIYHNSKNIMKRNDRVLYYDCTNFFFEIEEEDGFRKYGASKEHRPNPIVQMGLIMDEDGIPLAFNMNPGNTNEQITLTPLEKTIEKDFRHSKFVMCTDSGLSSAANRLFNSMDDKAFVTTQSIKKMSDDMQKWVFERQGWRIINDTSGTLFDLDDIEKAETEAACEGKHSVYYDKLFYRSKKDIIEIEKPDVEQTNKEKYDYVHQTIYVTYSLKYREYLRGIRNRQIQRAEQIISQEKSDTKKGGITLNKKRQTDYRRFIESVNFTEAGELADHVTYYVNEEVIAHEEKYDGFYSVATNLEDPVETVLDINKKRWEIEECFRITKTNFKARPVYLSREDHIRAHFLVCFIALVIYRYLEKKTSTAERHYTTDEIIEQLRNMNFMASSGKGYIPIYRRTDFTDRLHQAFEFRTDYEIIPLKSMRKIIQNSKGK